MIWAVVIVLAVLLGVCVYQIRLLTARIHEQLDMISRTITLVDKLNSSVSEVAERDVLLAGRVSNNEHRIRDIYKSINQMKGWPSHEVEYRD